MAAPGGTVNLFGGCARESTFTIPTARVHYEQVTLLGTYHHTPRYLARALRGPGRERVPVGRRSPGPRSRSTSSPTRSPAA